jgi:putative endonuclease
MSTPWKWYAYIIECLDGTYYTGLIWNPDIRYEQHVSKFGSKYTQKHRVKKLVYLEEHLDLEVARQREKNAY